MIKPYYKALFCGDRNWSKASPIRKRLKQLKEEHGDHLIVIQGEASGADQMSRHQAWLQDIHVFGVHALWGTRYQAAGPQRNDAMLGLEPDEVNAYHDNLPKSKGTKDMVQKALKAGIPVRLNNRRYDGK